MLSGLRRWVKVYWTLRQIVEMRVLQCNAHLGHPSRLQISTVCHAAVLMALLRLVLQLTCPCFEYSLGPAHGGIAAWSFNKCSAVHNLRHQSPDCHFPEGCIFPPAHCKLGKLSFSCQNYLSRARPGYTPLVVALPPPIWRLGTILKIALQTLFRLHGPSGWKDSKRVVRCHLLSALPM